MKAIIYMNHHIRDKKSAEPFMTIQPLVGKPTYCNAVRIDGPCVVWTSDVPTSKVTTHDVRAWIECEADDIQVITYVCPT